MSIAKWWKRHFKRQKQTLKLFNKHILPKYPNSLLHLVGNAKDAPRQGNVIYYKRSFHNQAYVDVFKKSHINLVLGPFDVQPKTITESLYYRVPFVCSNNCVGQELIDQLGPCGKMVETDPYIRSFEDCRQYRPLTHSRFYGRHLDNLSIMRAIDDIVDNFGTYTSWKWTDQLSPETEAKKLANILDHEKRVD